MSHSALSWSISPVAGIDSPLGHALQQRLDNKTKPPGSLGQLERLALRIGLIQNTLSPRLHRPHMLVMAGDHGAAESGVSAFPASVTAQMVANFLAGGAAINVFCQQVGMAFNVVDAGILQPLPPQPGLIDARIGAGTRNYLRAPAMDEAQALTALQRGRALATDLAQAGCSVLGLGEMGIGNTASASLITHCLTGAALPDITGRGTGLDDAGLQRKRALLEQALARGGKPASALSVLAEYGGFEIAMLAGAMLGAAEQQLVILVDGFIVTAALLVAHALAPAVLDYCVFAHTSAEPGHVHQLNFLHAEALLQLGLRLGEGSGAALAYPLLVAAVNMLNDMASFASAGIDGPDARPESDQHV